jgi:hypothetical protein
VPGQSRNGLKAVFPEKKSRSISWFTQAANQPEGINTGAGAWIHFY